MVVHFDWSNGRLINYAIGQLWGKYLLHSHGLVADCSVEDRAVDEPDADVAVRREGCQADIWRRLGVELAEMDLAVFHGDEADEVCPLRHFCGVSKEEVETQVDCKCSAIIRASCKKQRKYPNVI